MDQGKTIQIQDILEAMQKRWYWVTLPLFFFILLGAWIYVVMPRQYEASTLILVQPQEIPRAYVETTVSTAIEERVRTLSQEVMSRSNLEKIITEMNLFSEGRKQGSSMEIIVAAMRLRIRVDTRGGRRGETSSFTISYRGRSPEEAADVANRLASFFIESNLRLRARQAAQTTLFLEKQLEDLNNLLKEQELKVEKYRNRYMGELPEQLQSNISTIASLQSRLESVQSSLADAMNRKLSIQSQLSQLEGGQSGVTISQRMQRINELRTQLEEMRIRYTSEHPVIKQLEEQIIELQKQPEEAQPARTDPQILEIRNQLAAMNIEIESLKKDQNRLKEKIDYYQHRVENTPKREQELAALTRDYRITQENYQRLLDRYYEAKRAESLEKRQQGEQFRILDLAKPPQAPISPDRNKLGLVFLALGLVSGAGIIFLFEFLDNTIKGVKQLEGWSGDIPCISAVPLALTHSDIKRRGLKTVLMVLLNIFVVGAGLIGIIYSRAQHIIIELPINLPF